ncbi:MAG: DUF4418 family protein [Lachnospiraceae bacterium]|nr:DUF4418 family protein [Lachnospiraceae bacterium]
MKNKVIVGGLYTLAGIFYIIGPKFIFDLCKDESMNCHKSVNAVLAIAIAVIVAGVLYFFSNTKRERIFLSIIEAVLGIDVLLILLVLIKGCGMADMACQRSTFPGLYGITVLLLLVVAINIVVTLLWSGKNEDDIEETESDEENIDKSE